MKVFQILVFLAFFGILNAAITTTVTEVVLSPLEYANYYYLYGCTKYNKTVKVDDQNPSVQNVSYQCIECDSNYTDGENVRSIGWNLKLITLVTGQTRCAKSFFYTQGCLKYAILPQNYSDLFDQQSYTINNLRFEYHRPYTCADCPSNGNRLVKYDVTNYLQFECIYLGEDYQWLYQGHSTTLHNLQICVPESSLESACSKYTGLGEYGTIDLSKYPDQFIQLTMPSNIVFPQTKQCTACSPGFTLQSQCTQCDSSQGLMRSNEHNLACVPSTPNCKNYQNTDTCHQCNTGFLLQNNRCDVCDTQSGFIASGNSCVCASGYRPSSTGEGCILLVPHCDPQSYVNDVCTACLSNHQLQNNKCQNCKSGFRLSQQTPDACVQSVTHCTSYENDVCKSCQAAYKLQAGNCQQCNTGYRQSDSNSQECVLSVKNCATYQLNACSSCITGYQLENGKCQNCAQGYRISQVSQNCIPAISRCTLYQNDVCNSCQTGYKLSGGNCQTCDASKGYIVSPTDSSFCILPIKNCAVYQQSACSTCTLGYALINNKCDTCAQNYRISNLNSQKCVAAVAGCYKYKNDLCTQCESGKRFSDIDPTKCVNSVQDCRSYENDVCQECIPGYNFPNGNTSKCELMTSIPNCKNYLGFGNNFYINGILYCLACYPGYHLRSDFTLCLPDIPNCLIDVNDQCSLCKYGYYLNPTKTQCILNPVCPANTLIAFYLPFGGICVGIDINCKSYNESGECLSCKTGYRLSSNKCIKSFLNWDSSSDS